VPAFQFRRLSIQFSGVAYHHDNKRIPEFCHNEQLLCVF